MRRTPTQPEFHLAAHSYTALAPGVRLIVLGAVHGNETCGTQAIKRTIDDIERGHLELMRGSVTLVPVTNPLAYQFGRREGERNLNRNLRPTDHPADFEDRIANWLCPLLERHDVLLDLHSFHTPGEPFVMLGPENNAGALEPFSLAAEERAFARHLGVRRFVDGWLDTYARGVSRRIAAGTALGSRRGSALRDRYQRVHAQRGRLRRHAGMRRARRPERPRDGISRDPQCPCLPRPERMRCSPSGARTPAACAWSTSLTRLTTRMPSTTSGQASNRSSLASASACATTAPRCSHPRRLHRVPESERTRRRGMVLSRTPRSRALAMDPGPPRDRYGERKNCYIYISKLLDGFHAHENASIVIADPGSRIEAGLSPNPRYRACTPAKR
jgi:hypothetical protein